MYPELNAQYEKILASLDTARMMKTTKELLDLEVGQTFSSYHASAQRTFEILQEMGIPNAEKITYAANGKAKDGDGTNKSIIGHCNGVNCIFTACKSDFFLIKVFFH